MSSNSSSESENIVYSFSGELSSTEESSGKIKKSKPVVHGKHDSNVTHVSDSLKSDSNFLGSADSHKRGHAMVKHYVNTMSEFYTGSVCIEQLNWLGNGSYGCVYWGHETSNAEVKLAVKVIHQKHYDEDELIILQHLSKCPHVNIVQMFEHTVKEDFHFISMEFCSGGDLDTFTDSVTLSVDEIKSFSCQMADAFCHLSTLNIVHRDIKMTNILIAYKEGYEQVWQNRIYKIADFGLSIFLEDGSCKGKVGTDGYWAPEVMMCQNYDLKADYYSMGVVLYQCLFDDIPFDGQDNLHRVAEMAIGVNVKKFENIDPYLTDLIIKLLTFDPKERPDCYEYHKHSFHDDAFVCRSQV